MRRRFWHRCHLPCSPICLGYRAKLSSSSSNIRGRTEQGLMFHADHSTKNPSAVGPLRSTRTSLGCSRTTRVIMAPSAWSREATAGVYPPDDFVMAHDHEGRGGRRGACGSVVVFHGSLWHGALPRKNDGQRISLALCSCRDHIQTQEAYWRARRPRCSSEIRDGSRPLWG